MRGKVAFLSVLVGGVAATAYVIAAFKNAGLQPGPGDELRKNIVLFEGFIVLVTITGVVGRFIYGLLKAPEEGALVKRQFSAIGVLLKLVGIAVLAFGMMARLRAGQALALQDAASVAVMALLLLWSFADWWGSRRTTEPARDD